MNRTVVPTAAVKSERWEREAKGQKVWEENWQIDLLVAWFLNEEEKEDESG